MVSTDEITPSESSGTLSVGRNLALENDVWLSGVEDRRQRDEVAVDLHGNAEFLAVGAGREGGDKEEEEVGEQHVCRCW